MIRVAFSIFLTGIVLGSGPCLATCGPILISYIAATRKNPVGSLKSWFIFSLTRTFTYTALGAIAGIIGSSLYQSYYWQTQGYIIWFIGGIFICFLGGITIIGKDIHSKVCQRFYDIFIKKDIKSIIGLGVIIGLFPCAPLIGILSYISMISVYLYQGIILAFLFGLGTMISPLVFLSLGAGLLPKFNTLQNENIYKWFQRIAGVILFLLGLHILVRTIIGILK